MSNIKNNKDKEVNEDIGYIGDKDLSTLGSKKPKKFKKKSSGLDATSMLKMLIPIASIVLLITFVFWVKSNMQGTAVNKLEREDNISAEETASADQNTLSNPQETVGPNTELTGKTIEEMDYIEDTSQEIALNENVKVDVNVNTKITEDYEDIASSVFVKFNGITTGYDNVFPFVEEYNANEMVQNKVNIPSKEEYKKKFKGCELLMLEFETTYPKDFPTYLLQGEIYEMYTLNPQVIGKVEEINSKDFTGDYREHLLVNDSIYKIPVAQLISVAPDVVMAGESIKTRFIISLPKKSTSNEYKIHLSVANQSGAILKEMDFAGQEVK